MEGRIILEQYNSRSSRLPRNELLSSIFSFETLKALFQVSEVLRPCKFVVNGYSQ